MADKLWEEGGHQFHAGNYDSSIYYFELSNKIWEAVGDWNRFANGLNKIAELHGRSGRYPQALEATEKALSMILENYGEIHNQAAVAYSNLGNLSGRAGDIEASKTYHLKSLNIYKELDPEGKGIGTAYENVANVFSYEGDFESALNYYEKALEARVRTLFPEHPYIFSSYNSMGLAHFQLLDYDQAAFYFEKAIEFGMKSLGEKHPMVYRAFANMGRVYAELGNFEKSLEYLIRAHNSGRNSFGEFHESTALSNSYLSKVYWQKGDIGLAMEKANRALEIQENMPGVIHHELAETLSNIGMIHYQNGNYTVAIDYINKAIDMQIKLFGENHPTTAQYYYNLGKVYNLIDDPLAMENLEKSVSINTRIFGPKHPNLAMSYNELASYHSGNDNLEDALEILQKALISNTLEFGDSSLAANPMSDDYLNPNVLLETLQAKAGIYASLSKSEDELSSTLEIIHRSDELIDKIRTTHQRYEDRIQFGKVALQTYETAIPICIEAYKFNEDDSFIDRAFYYIEKSKAAALNQNISDSYAKQFSGIPDSLLLIESSLKALKSYYQAQITENISQINDLDSSRLVNAQNRMFEINLTLDSLMQSFENSYPRYYELKRQPITASRENIQDKLESNQAVFEFMDAENSYYLIIITKDNIEISSIDKDVEFESYLNNFLNSITAESLNSPEAVEMFGNSSYGLFKALLEPVLKKLDPSIDQLVIIPDGTLSYFPWEHLVMSLPKSGTDFKSLDYLFRKYAVSYAYSSSLYAGDRIQITQNAPEKILAVAAQYGEISEQFEDLAFNFRNEISPLKWNKVEIEEIQKYFQGQYVSGLQATERNFKEEVNNYKILHLAMHALVDDRNPMQSQLLFTQSEDSIEDGRLYTYELFNMNIPAELTVLSACNTGIGKLQKGEGVMSLGRAFSYAGCPSVVMSHWSVDDKSTSEIMSSFYKYLEEGQPKHFALRQAKLDFLENATGIKSHPYYWGGFVVLGDTSPISKGYNLWLFIGVAIGVIAIIIVYMRNRERFEI